MDQPGMIKAIDRGYALPDLGRGAEHAAGQPVDPDASRARTAARARTRSAIAKAKSLLTSHGWARWAA